jgi:hypothetical protein
MKPETPINRDSAVYKAILEEEKSHTSNQYDHLHGSPLPSTQSQAFRRLQQALDDDTG